MLPHPPTRAPAVRSAPQRRLRWVLAHEPPVVFEDASEHFVHRVREKTDGELGVELFLGPEYSQARGEYVSRTELVRCVQRGEIEMAHCYVAALGAFHDPLWAVELPFLFRDYDHAERVFEGPAGRALMDGLLPKGIRGLAFAYSGGKRILPTLDRALHTLEDFRGLRLRTSGNPVPQALHEALGARPVGAPLDAIASMTADGLISGCEITYVRFRATGLHEVFPVVNETHHSLFTTMTVVNERWFRGLPERHQVAVAEAAAEACRAERRVAIREEARAAEACAGTHTVVRMADSERERLRQVALQVRERMAPRFGESIVQAILDA